MLGKREREEEKKIVRQTVKSMLGSAHQASGTPYQMMKLSEMMNARAHNMIDLGYVKTLLFPELYNADVPQPMSTQSYCRFTDKKEVTLKSSISSAAQGAILVWYPKTVIGPQLFIRYGSLDTAQKLVIPTTDATALDTTWKMVALQDYSDYFTQGNLVAASLSIQYIGQLQLEQGYMVGSQTYGVSPDSLTSDDVENGQFRAMCKPGDGLRITYLPKDISDFQYYPITKTSAKVKAKNSGNRPEGETYSVLKAGGALTKNWVGTVGSWPKYVTNAAKDTAAVDEIVYNTDGDAVVIFWKGLSVPSSEDLRIDIVRKFNGFPASFYRDILDLTKPKKLFDPKKTIDVIQELQTAIPQLCGHSLKQMDRVSDQIQEFIPNIGHLYDEGMLKEGTSLEGFASQLQQIAGNEGANTTFPGRIYD